MIMKKTEYKKTAQTKAGYRKAFLALIVGVFLLAGCNKNGLQENNLKAAAPPESVPQASTQPENVPQASTRPENNSAGSAAQENAVSADATMEQAKNAALEHAGLEASNVTFIKEKLDYDNGAAEYEVEFITDTTKYEYEISALDLTVLKVSQEPIVQTQENRTAQGEITLEEAKAAALAYAGFSEEQVNFTKLEQDYDDGKAEYEIEFLADKKEYDFTIDASTGEILEVDIDMD